MENDNILTPQQAEEESFIDLMELFNLVKGKIAWILVFSLIGAVVAYAYSSFMITPIYSSTAVVYVNNRKSTAYIDSVSQRSLTVSARLVPTYQYIIRTKTAMQRAIDSGEIEGYTAEQLMGMLSTTTDEETGVFYITVFGHDRYALADIANAIAMYSTLEIGTYIEGTDISVIEDAVTPEQPAYPNSAKNAAIGFVLGAVLSALVVILMEYLKSGLKKTEDFAKALNAPVLGIIPGISEAEGSAKQHKHTEEGKN